MINCIINGIQECHKFSVGGIKQLWIVPFDDIYDYTYTDDELGKVTGFRANVLPVEYAVIEAQFDEEFVALPYNNYVHSFSFTVPKLSYQKRNELEKLAGSYVTILFKDKNGLCWITGFDSPLKMNRQRTTTGGDASQYSVSATGNSRYQVKECVCFDPNCFASFNGTEFRTSTFTIETASLYDFGADWQIVADDALLTYTPNQDLDPVNWSNPTIYAQDLAELQALIGNPSTSITLNYDGGTDVATITLYSSDTSYDYLVFAEQRPIRSVVNITLNLVFVLTPLLNAATTTITVTDSDLNVVYTGNPFDPISGTGLSGTVGNALIDVTALYSEGTTFTATVENVSCETKQYVFVYENLVNCDAECVISYNYGRHYSVSVPKNDTFNLRYQQIILHYDEWQFNIIANQAEATDDFATVEASVLAKLTSDPNCPIISSSISVTETPLTILIEFDSTRRNSTLYAIYKADEALNSYGYIAHSAGKQTNIMNVQSLVPSNSYVTIINQSTTDRLGGQFGNTPDLNEGYILDDIDGTMLIEDAGFDISSYIEEESWALNVTSISCPETNVELNTAVCYDERVLTIERRYDKFTCDVSANVDSSLSGAFVFSYSIGATPYAIVVNAGPINNNNGTDALSIAVLNTLPLHLGDNPVKVLSFRYNPLYCTFVLELDCHTDIVWDYIEGDRDDVAQAFTLDESYDITDCEFDPIINPHTNVDWYFTDVDGTIVSNNDEALAEFTRWRDADLVDVAYFNYNSGTNDMTVALGSGTNQTIIRFNFYDASFNLLEQIALVAPSTTDTQPLVSDPNDIAYVAITSPQGAFWWVSWNAGVASNINVYIPNNALNRNLWGYMNRWHCLTPAVFVPSPVITSVLCP